MNDDVKDFYGQQERTYQLIFLYWLAIAQLSVMTPLIMVFVIACVNLVIIITYPIVILVFVVTSSVTLPVLVLVGFIT